MTDDNDENIAVAAAKSVSRELSGSTFPQSLARLYSHHTRLRAGEPGLPSWSVELTDARLRDVKRLIHSAFVLKDQKYASGAEWKKPLLRAGEILEWLDHPSVHTQQVPVHLLSAGCYQMAGYSARASGLLNSRESQGQFESSSYLEHEILSAFFRSEFTRLYNHIVNFWGHKINGNQEKEYDSTWGIVFEQTVRSMGVLYSYIRWGNHERIDEAISKLDRISKVLLHSDNQFSWILSKLVYETAQKYHIHSMRYCLYETKETLSKSGKLALENYVRYNYLQDKAIAWPSQRRGFEKINDKQSFALCTPTGSGKTTVAEVALLNGLFEPRNRDANLSEPLALYLVPSRALAAEVESEIDEVLSSLEAESVTVTGLYGGVDWGPTDTMLSDGQKTVLVCTYEKAEAILRFIGSSFVDRINLIVIDEAHKVEHRKKDQEQLIKGNSRPLTFESITSRIIGYTDGSVRVIALSAVAEDIDDILASWVSRDENSQAISVHYQSTRNLIGRLKCHYNRRYEIEYDLLDGREIKAEAARKPFVPNPFPPCPEVPDEYWETSPIKQLRPSALWAAINIAAPGEGTERSSVFIFVPQNAEHYAKTFVELLCNHWEPAELPNFFDPPTEEKKLARISHDEISIGRVGLL